MLARLVHKQCATNSLLKTVPRVFSTSPALTGTQSSEKFYLRHQEDSKHVSASKWKLYRVASVGLLGGLTACFICPGNAVVDFATVTLLVHHNYANVFIPKKNPDSVELWLKRMLLHVVYLRTEAKNFQGGLNAVIADYVPLFFPDGVTAAVKNFWFFISILTLALLYGFNYNDVGFSKTLVALFKL